MANYSTIQALFDAGITNMTQGCTAGNHYAWSSDQITFPLSGFVFKSYTMNNYIVGSNGYISSNWNRYDRYVVGFKQTGDNHLKLFYYESGTVDNLSYFKIRWDGYYDNYNSAYYHMAWDTVFFSNGSIAFYLAELGARMPSYINQVYFNNTAVMTITLDNPYVTWYSQDSTGTEFTVVNALPDFTEPEIKYLFKKFDGTYCTIVDGEVTDLSITELTASVFQNNGCSEEDLDESLVASIASPGSMDIYKWNSKNTAALSAAMRAIPTPKNVTATIDVPTDATGLSSAVAVASNSTLWVVSLDGTAWKYWDAENNEWVTALVDEGVAMCSELANISASDWASFLGSATQFIFRFTLGIEDDELTSVTFTWAQ